MQVAATNRKHQPSTLTARPPGRREGKRPELARTSPSGRVSDAHTPAETGANFPQAPQVDRWDHRSLGGGSLGPGTNRARRHPAWKTERSHPFACLADRSHECPVLVHAPWSEVSGRSRRHGGAGFSAGMGIASHLCRSGDRAAAGTPCARRACRAAPRSTTCAGPSPYPSLQPAHSLHGSGVVPKVTLRLRHNTACVWSIGLFLADSTFIPPSRSCSALRDCPLEHRSGAPQGLPPTLVR